MVEEKGRTIQVRQERSPEDSTRYPLHHRECKFSHLQNWDINNLKRNCNLYYLIPSRNANILWLISIFYIWTSVVTSSQKKVAPQKYGIYHFQSAIWPFCIHWGAGSRMVLQQQGQRCIQKPALYSAHQQHRSNPSLHKFQLTCNRCQHYKISIPCTTDPRSKRSAVDISNTETVSIRTCQRFICCGWPNKNTRSSRRHRREPTISCRLEIG